MERKERIPTDGHNALLVAVQAALDGFQSKVWTALPAFVQSYNAAKLTVECQPTIQAQVRQPDGTWVDTTLPLCVDCPVMFPGGGGFTLTFPIAAQTEGLLVFASRCIDAWWQSGGIQKQAELRMHDLSDGFFFPTGGLSNPNVPANASTTTAQLRSNDGLTYVELANGSIVNIVAPNGVNIVGNLAVTGGLLLGGTIEAHAGGVYAGDIKTSGNVIAGDGTGDQVGLKTHTHTSELAGNQTSSPTPGT